MCEHNAKLFLPFFALLIAYVILYFTPLQM